MSLSQTGTISPLAVVETDALGRGVTIGEFAIVRAGATIGDHVVIHPHAIVAAGVTLGENVEVFPGAYIGREPKGAGATARPPVFERSVRIGANTSVGPHAIIYYDVEIGEHTLIGDGASIREQCRIGSRCIISRYVTINYNTTIGDRTKIMDLTHITGNGVIGSDVFVSVNVGSTNDNAIGQHGYSDERVVGPTIRDGAMIGAGVMLLPAVVIGERSIIGAGAVVTKSVEADSLMMGMPARLVRRIERAP
jgi:acetyltransferase-like isoleucine patch superfamily enzyme